MDERHESDTQTESCRQCGDTGWMIEADRGTRWAQRCECWAVRQAAAMLEAAGIPERYADCSFDNFTVYDNGYLEAAIRRARQFAVDFPVVKKGLLFIGRPGVGKTHLAVATLRAAMAESNLQGAFEDTRRLLASLRHGYEQKSRDEAKVYERIIDAELLVLDDIGAERRTAWVEDTLDRLETIVIERYNAKRPTIFTTNYFDNDDAIEGLRVRIGSRLLSRLHEMCHWYELYGPDYRTLGRNPPAKVIEDAARRMGLYKE